MVKNHGKCISGSGSCHCNVSVSDRQPWPDDRSSMAAAEARKARAFMEQNQKWYCRASHSTTTVTQCDLEHAGPHCGHSQSAADGACVPVLPKTVNHGRRTGAHRLCDERGLRGPCAEFIKPHI